MTKLTEHEVKADPPTVLYHYTDAAGLIGILRGRLWLSNIQSMNDRSEFEHGLEVISKRVQASTRIRESGLASKLFDEFMRWLDPGTDYRLNPRHSIFLISFSSKENDLNQWRAYCPSAGGFAVGIKASALEEGGCKYFARDSDQPVADSRGIELRRCIYDDGEKEDAADSLVENWQQEYEKLRNVDTPEAMEKTAPEVMHSIYKKLALLSCSLKDSAFSEESEHRLIASCRPGSGAEFVYTQSEGFIKPRVVLQLQGDAIQEIWVGPSRDQPRALAGIQSLLLNEALADKEIKVEVSTIPFREG